MVRWLKVRAEEWSESGRRLSLYFVAEREFLPLEGDTIVFGAHTLHSVFLNERQKGRKCFPTPGHTAHVSRESWLQDGPEQDRSAPVSQHSPDLLGQTRGQVPLEHLGRWEGDSSRVPGPSEIIPEVPGRETRFSVPVQRIEGAGPRRPGKLLDSAWLPGWDVELISQPLKRAHPSLLQGHEKLGMQSPRRPNWWCL